MRHYNVIGLNLILLYDKVIKDDNFYEIGEKKTIWKVDTF